MVNKTKFYKTKVALAVVLSLGLAACGDSDGDEGSTSTSVSDATQNSTSEQHALTGTVSGKVQDTNGRPVAGAMVYFMGKETTTDAGGNYVFADVLVTNLNGNNDNGTGNEADEIPSSLTVTITGPEGYLSAVVNVTPQAVVNNTGTNTANGGSADVTASTFIDGFAAEAGIAVIAEENSMVTGYLRIGNSTPAAGETVYLDFTGYAAPNTTLAGSAGGTAGAVVTVTPGEYTAVTEADGSFTFENVPADSAFVLGVTGKTISTADTDATSNGSFVGVNGTDGTITVATPFEQDENFVGTFEVIDNEFAVEEDVRYAPWVASVNGVLNPTVGILDGGVTYGDLDDGINKEIVINFSEALDTTKFDSSKVKVAETGAQYLATDSVTLSPDGLSLTVVFTEELAPGTKFTVFISQASSIDDEGNALVITRDITNAATATNAAPYADGSVTTIVYDDLSPITTKAKYIEVNLCTYLDGNSGVEAATAVQVFDEDTAADGTTAGLQAYSDAFRDAENSEDNGAGTATDIAQLNGQVVGTSAKLKALGDAVLGVIGAGETIDEVDADFPWVTINTGNASSFTISTGSTDANVVKIADDSPVAYVGATTTTAAIAASSASASVGVDYGIDGAKDGDKVTVTFMDDFGVAAASEEITLIDALPPVTTLQESYDLSSAAGVYGKILSTAGEADYGNGGEVSNDGSSAEVGNPIIWVQPRHLQQKGLNNAQPSRSSLNTFGTLSNLAPRLGTGETGFTAATYIDNRATYDAQAYTAWSATSVGNEIGIDFSEDIALTTTAPSPTGITAGLSAYIVNNNVTTDIDGNSLAGKNADLVQVTVADIMTLANVDNTGFVDFVGAVRDTSAAENTATAASNAKVIFRDAMPPLVTAAEWDGTEITLTFNEAIAIDATTTIRLVNPTNAATFVNVTLDPSVAATANTGFVLSNGDKTVTVNVSGTPGINTVFEGSATADTEFFYEDGGNAGQDQHAIVRWDNITDATDTRNKWDLFTPAAADLAGSQTSAGTTFGHRHETEAPQFLMVNGVGSYNYTVSTSGYLDANALNGDDDGTVTYTITFSHPIDLSSSNAFSDEVNTLLGTPGFPIATNAVINASTANTVGMNFLNNVFTVDTNGAAAAATPFVLVTTGVSAPDSVTPADGGLLGGFSLSADQRVMTLTVTGVANIAGSITFGISTVAFDVETTSALTQEQTSAAPFGWQNVN